MISLNDYVKKTTDIKIKLPGGDENILCLTVNLNHITPAERAKYFADGDTDLLAQIRAYLPVIIVKWDLKIDESDKDFAPIDAKTLALIPDRILVIIYEKVLEASSKLEGELIN